MENAKRKICLITNWYPTKENPYQGVFFKEQAQALEDYFEFIVVHYNEKKKDSIFRYIIRKARGKNLSVHEMQKEKNTVEYNAVVYFPKYKKYTDKLGLFIKRRFRRVVRKKQNVDELSPALKRRKEAVTKIFHKYFSNEIDVFYCVDAQSESFILQCAAEAVGKPYIISEHAPFPNVGNIIAYSEKKAMEEAALFMAISNDKIRQVLMQNIKPKKIAYVGNMVDENQFMLKKGGNEVKTFIMVAANSFYKNYDLFVEVFERLTEITKVPFKVMVAGYGANKGYSKNADELEKRILDSKFGEYAELIPEVSHDKIPEVYCRADAFVMTSIQEGMPVSALEAGCCGLPIFSTVCGGIEDYVDEKMGRIYGIIDSESFANGLKDYLEGKIIFDSNYIRNYVIENYGKKAFTDRMVKLFNSVMGQQI